MTVSDYEILKGMYGDLTRGFQKAEICPAYLKNVVGIELFNTDSASLVPDLEFVLDSLAKAEGILVKFEEKR